MHVKKVHRTKSDSPEQANHVLHKLHSLGIRHSQLSSQRRGEGWDQCVVIRWFHLRIGLGEPQEEFQVFQVLKHSDEVYDLTVGPFGFSEGKRSNPWEEVTEVILKVRHELGDIQVL